jgi:hypothetical protein
VIPTAIRRSSRSDSIGNVHYYLSSIHRQNSFSKWCRPQPVVGRRTRLDDTFLTHSEVMRYRFALSADCLLLKAGDPFFHSSLAGFQSNCSRLSRAGYFSTRIGEFPK